ncbi:hypothetical protein ACX3PU_00415 [Chryseobacterium sp. A301]
MINARVIELLKSPPQIKEQDLKLVSKEIAKYPYVQSLRALYLLGTHMYKAEQYPSVLHTTAAYTTDKKILYHFINNQAAPSEAKKEMQEQEPVVENQQLATSTFETVLPKEKRTLPVVHINGERNRILFEGEENFLSEKAPKIDWEQTQESGKLSPVVAVELPTSDSTEIEIEKSQNEQDVSALEIEKEVEKEIGEAPSEGENNVANLSFQGVDSFLPEVSIVAKESPSTFAPKQSSDRHQDEMQRLIAEVEAKIKAKKKEAKESEPQEESPSESIEINFSQVSQFEFSNEKESEKEQAKDSSPTQGSQVKASDSPVVSHSQGWKPMFLPTSVGPLKSAEKPSNIEKETANQKHDVIVEEPTVEIEAVVEPKMDVSTPKEKPTQESLQNSNIPEFINTWQSWLKIDRSQEPAEKSTLLTIDQVRNKAIDTFIENQPKISKLKEESSFVIKEKPDDISHLMTETLVGLYVEQRLYSKAIRGYEVLQEKHPEKHSEYGEKIEEIKSRTGK